MPERLDQLSGRELAQHLSVLRARVETQVKEFDVVLDVLDAVVGTLEERYRDA